MAFFKGAAREAQRAAQLMQQRDRDRQEIDMQKRKLEAEMRIGNITNKFATHYDAVEQRLKSDTVGLVTLTEMRAKQEAVITARENQLIQATSRAAYQAENKRRNNEITRRNQIQALSFNFDEDDDVEEEECVCVSDNLIDAEPQNLEDVKGADYVNSDWRSETTDADVANQPVLAVTEDVLLGSDKKQIEQDKQNIIEDWEASLTSECHSDIHFTDQFIVHQDLKRKRYGKNPNVDTSELPDVDRDEEENRLRVKLRVEWIQQQIKLKEEEITITYSYWDGCGHRYNITMKKGTTIALFLHSCLDQLRKKFNELRSVTHDQLMYVKEDLIIPHHYSFYDFIVTKARGKSGPLFCFDAHEDIRVRSDASVAKDESHAGKVCLRSWYERNKHIFPASRWEPYDATKNWDEYTISDKMAIKVTVR